MHTNHLNKKPARDGNPTAGQHTSKAEINLRLHTMASNWHRMSDGNCVDFTIKDGHLQSTWNPSIQLARKLRRIVKSGKYHHARQAFFAAVSARTGGAVVCVDL
jgi:hypothetical protein